MPASTVPGNVLLGQIVVWLSVTVTLTPAEGASKLPLSSTALLLIVTGDPGRVVTAGVQR